MQSHMRMESTAYYRRRERQECEAALSAACPAARRAHAEMAAAYRGLVASAEAKERTMERPEAIGLAESMRMLVRG